MACHAIAALLKHPHGQVADSVRIHVAASCKDILWTVSYVQSLPCPHISYPLTYRLAALDCSIALCLYFAAFAAGWPEQAHHWPVSFSQHWSFSAWIACHDLGSSGIVDICWCHLQSLWCRYRGQCYNYSCWPRCKALYLMQHARWWWAACSCMPGAKPRGHHGIYMRCLSCHTCIRFSCQQCRHLSFAIAIHSITWLQKPGNLNKYIFIYSSGHAEAADQSVSSCKTLQHQNLPMPCSCTEGMHMQAP